MNMIITKGKHSYMVNSDTIDATVEIGSIVFVPEEKAFYIVCAPGEMMQVDVEDNAAAVEAFLEAISAGGEVELTQDINTPAGIVIETDTALNLNGKEISVSTSEDYSALRITNGTTIITGSGTVNGVGNNDYNIAMWVSGNGKVIINDGFYTNGGATAEVDPSHFDLIYASGNGQIEINGGEFKCETPRWTLNVKDGDRATAKIIVKGGKFHGFDPSNCLSEGPNTNFVAPGYKAIEDNGIFTVVIDEDYAPETNEE